MTENSAGENIVSQRPCSSIHGYCGEEAMMKDGMVHQSCERRMGTYVALVCVCCAGAIEMASSRSIDILLDETDAM